MGLTINRNGSLDWTAKEQNAKTSKKKLLQAHVYLIYDGGIFIGA